MDLADLGEQMVRQRLRREHPDFDEEGLHAAFVRWLQDRPTAPFGDYPGLPSTRVVVDNGR